MSDQYMYDQPLYGQNVQYQTENAGADFEAYQTSSLPMEKKKTIIREPISYETFENQQQVYYGQNQPYTQQVYIQQQNQGNQVYDEIPGYNNYQPQTIAQQQANMARQMIQQNQNIRPPFPSRNPHVRQQYPQQQPPLIQKKYSGNMNQQQNMYGYGLQKKYSGNMNQQQNMYGYGVQKKNSGNMNQQQNMYGYGLQKKYSGNMNQQQNMYGQYGVQKKYSGHMKQQQIYDNQDQFDEPQIEPDFQPEMPMANSILNQSKIPFQQNQSIQKRISGQLSQKSSGKIQNSLENEPNVQKSVEPIMEKENPIEEKLPDQSNVDYLNNPNQSFPQQSRNQSQVGDIDDNLDHLPTINSIMKGNSELLPPPKKKKYK